MKHHLVPIDPSWQYFLEQWAKAWGNWSVSRSDEGPTICEIRSGAVIPNEQIPGSFLIEANTAFGLRKFYPAVELALHVDVQSQANVPALVTSKTFYWDQLPVSMDREERVCESTDLDDDIENNRSLKSSDLLASLKKTNLPIDERRRLVIEAEAVTFKADEKDELQRLLWQFVQSSRDSDDADDLVSVGAAIRKYIAIMPAKDLGSIVTLLEPGHIIPIPVEVELEITKMIRRKLLANPPTRCDSRPKLAAHLNELASAYLHERLLPREKYGAIALNSVLGLAMLSSRHLAVVVKRLKQLQQDWFRQLVLRNAQQLRTELEESPGKRAAVSKAGLNQLIEGLTE